MELCSILRISINEFLAGEDIGTENVIEKSDSNLILDLLDDDDDIQQVYHNWDE